MVDRGNTASLSLSHPHHSSSSSEDDTSGHPVTPLALPPAAATTTEKSSIGSELGSPSPRVKKPRGRPPGSKNKPKPPVVITAAEDSSGLPSSSAMRLVVLEISAGSDVVDALTSFAIRRRTGLAVLSGFGSVSDVTLRHSLPHVPPLSLHGTFNLLSLSGSVLGGCINDENDNNNESKNDRPAKQLCRQEGSSYFGITLAGAQGQVFGGVVGGKVVAATPVVVAAATFVGPSFHRFPSGGDEDGGDHQETKPCIGGGVGGTEPPPCPSSAAGIYCRGGGLSGQAMSPEEMAWNGGANSTSRPPY